MTFHLTITTPEQQVFSGEIESLIVPGSTGYLEILSHHAPLLTTLKEGKITLTQNQQKTTYTTSGGLLEVQNNQAILLATSLNPTNPPPS
jgi:F-type H+-transporting ATPase subunit epsilon